MHRPIREKLADFKVDFFIAGLPRCGTTSLAAALANHPQICFSHPKETNYFCPDCDGYSDNRLVPNLNAYHACFDFKPGRHLLSGEGTAIYAYSDQAFELIRDYNPAARFILMVRNPADMLQSLHLHRRYYGIDEGGLEEAWRRDKIRSRDHTEDHANTVTERPGSKSFSYLDIAAFGRQMEKLLRYFPGRQSHLIMFDDFMADPKRTYLDLLRFLGLEDDGRDEFEPLNPTKIARPGNILHRLYLLVFSPVAVRRFNYRLKRLLGITDWGIMERLNRRTGGSGDLPSMEPSLRREILTHYLPEMERLEQLAGCDLSVWRAEIETSER